MFRRFAQLLCLLALVWGLSSCESGKAKAIKELQAQGIEMSGMRLLRAVEDGESEILELLLRAGIYAGQRDAEGRMPLHVAVARGDTPMVTLLLDHGASIDGQTSAGCTSLALALTADDSELAELLISRGAKPDGLTPGGERLLPWAIRQNRTEDIRLLMRAGADPHWKDEAGNPLLHLAITADSRALVKELIELGSDCGAVDVAGESALVLALRNDWRDLVRPLVRAGADPNAPDREGVKPFVRAFESGDSELAQMLVDLGAVPGREFLDGGLEAAYARRDFQRSRALLAFGAKPSISKETCLVRRASGDDETGFLHLFLGYTLVPEGLLYENCRRGRHHVASILMSHGASVNPSRTPFLGTPFGLAIEQGGDPLALELLEAGALPGGLTTLGADPLHVAIVYGRAQTVRHLLQRGGDPTAEVKGPHSPAFLDSVRGKTMRWLLEKDSRITPIMLAVDSGVIDTVRVLMEHGASKNVRTRRSSIWPINIAAKNADIRMMRLLLGKNPHTEERRVIVDLSDQQLTVFDGHGAEIYKTKISSGKPGYATPTGEFAITNRYRHWRSTIYHSSMPFFQRLSCSDFGFHQGYVPGRPASHGCIRVPSGQASKLFQITQLGDRVSIVP